MKVIENNHNILKALSENTRFNIIMILSSGPKCVCEIFEKLNLKQSVVSHHLSVLRESGLVKTEKDGKWIYYFINKKKLVELQGFIETIINMEEKKSKCN